MGKSDRRFESDEGYLNSAYEWAGDLAQGHNLAVRLVLTPTDRKGVWRVRAQALHTADKTALGIVCQAHAEYPNGRATTFAALVFALLTDLACEMGKDPLNQN